MTGTRQERPAPEHALEFVQGAAGPVCGRKKRGKHFTAVPRCLDVEAERVLGTGKKSARLRAAYEFLWLDPTFHGSGVFRPDLTRLVELLGVQERTVRSLLQQLQRAGLIVWHPRRIVVCILDAPIWNVRSTQSAQNWQAEIARFGDIEPVRASARFMGPVRPTCSQPSTDNSQRPTEQTIRQRVGIAAGCLGAVFEDEELLAGLPRPCDWSVKRVSAALVAGDEEEGAKLAVAVLHAAQRQAGRDTDAPAYAMKLARERLEVGDTPEDLLRRIAVRIPGDPRWLAANACFDLHTGVADTTDGLVWNVGGLVDRPERWKPVICK